MSLFPIIVYYGTGRLWSGHKSTKPKKDSAKNQLIRENAYVDCLFPSLNFGQFVTWFENVTREAQNEVQTGISSPHRPSSLRLAVCSAMNEVLSPTGWADLDLDFLGSEVVASHPEHGRLPVNLLSDGLAFWRDLKTLYFRPEFLMHIVFYLIKKAINLKSKSQTSFAFIASGIVQLFISLNFTHTKTTFK